MPRGVYKRVKKRVLSPEHRRKIGLAGLGRKHTPEAREKIRMARLGKPRPEIQGERCYMWKGGITPIQYKIRTSLEYRLWRTAVFDRDNYTCVWCGARNGEGKRVVLNADHIKPFALFPELRLAIDNGRTLCVPCHRTTFRYFPPEKPSC